MKKGLFIIVLIILVGAVATAGPLGVGLKVGTPISLAFGGDWDDALDALDSGTGSNAARAGISCGVFGFYDFTPIVTLQIEALVALYVWEMEGKLTGQDFIYSSQLFLAEFPILAKLRLPLWRGAITILAGPDLFYAIGRIDGRREVGVAPPVDTGADVVNMLVYGATGGIGYDLPLGPGFLSFDARYTRMLTPLVGKDTVTAVESEQFIHAVNVYLSYGYRFGSRRGR